MKTLYSGGLLFDGNGDLQEDLGVLVEGKKISKICPIADFEGFSDFRVDTSGCTILPGLIDCHVHLVYSGEADPKSSLLKSFLDGDPKTSVSIKSVSNFFINILK